MKLSIVTVNFNNVQGFIETMNSILDQTFRDFEWIVIDGGSTDGFKELITTVPQGHLAYWCCEPDRGIYNAMNKGIIHSKGDYICFLNSGDIFYDSNVLDTVFHVEYESHVLYGDAIFTFNSDDGYKEVLRVYPDNITLSWLYHEAFNHQATFTRREVLEQFWFDENYRIMADRKIWLQIMLARLSFKHISIPVVKYDHSGLSATNGELWINELIALRDEVLPWYLKSRISRRIFSLKENALNLLCHIFY